MQGDTTGIRAIILLDWRLLDRDEPIPRVKRNHGGEIVRLLGACSLTRGAVALLAGKMSTRP